METVDLVVVGTYLNIVEAEIACSALVAAGIPAMLRRDDCGGVRPSLWLGGIGLLVRAHDAGAAAEILNTPVKFVVNRVGA